MQMGKVHKCRDRKSIICEEEIGLHVKWQKKHLQKVYTKQIVVTFNDIIYKITHQKTKDTIHICPYIIGNIFIQWNRFLDEIILSASI